MPSATDRPRPAPHVLAAFGVDAAAEPLAGGQGGSFRAGDIVLKPCLNPDEAAWAARVFEGLNGPDFRVARPVAASGSRWVVDGWAASQFIAGAHAGPNGGRWAETIAACEAFHAALRDVPRPGFFDDRQDPWSVADRLAWGEVAMEPLPLFAQPIRRLQALLRPVDLPSQVIHGDFTANVLFADGLSPGVIDFAPYWRPAGFAVGVIIADALTWAGADESILALAAHVPEFLQLLARAELRRVLELVQHARGGRPSRPGEVAAHLPTIALIERYVAGLRAKA